MQIFINIVISFLLMFWPVILMMSPMMFDAPGSENDKTQLVTIMLFLSYPVGIFLLLWLFGGNYFGVSGLRLSIVSSIVIAIVFLAFGFYSRLSNLASGIANSGYSIADNRSYYDGKLIEDADAESFVILDTGEFDLSRSSYASDRNHFYYNGARVEGVFPDNLRRLDIDREVYWLNDTQVIYDDRILVGADPDNFAGFDGFGGWAFSISSKQYRVYIHGKLLPDTDSSTFTPLNGFIAKDKFRVFESDKIILPEADAVSFELLDDHGFGKDKNHIYYLAHTHPFPIKDIDVESFEILERGFLRDKNHIYYTHQYESIEKLEQVDAASFQVTNYDDSTNSDAYDKNHYYYGEKIVGNRE